MLTGRTRYRIGWRKRLVMQVEHQYGLRNLIEGGVCGPYLGWRDATIEDMQAIDRGEVTIEKPSTMRRPPPPPPPPSWNRPQSRYVGGQAEEK